MKKLMTGILAVVAALSLAACGVQTQQKDTSDQAEKTSKQDTPKPLMDYVKDMDEMGLTVNDAKELDVATMPKEAKAAAAVQFSTDDGKMTLIRTKTDDDSTDVLSYYVDQDDQRGYAMGDLVLISDRTLARDWFEKYQDVVFRN